MPSEASEKYWNFQLESPVFRSSPAYCAGFTTWRAILAGSDGGHRGCALGKPKKKKKRALTEDEHRLISGAEKNQEQRSYYEMLWLTGGSQTDIALTAENIDRKTPMSPFRNSG